MWLGRGGGKESEMQVVCVLEVGGGGVNTVVFVPAAEKGKCMQPFSTFLCAYCGNEH